MNTKHNFKEGQTHRVECPDCEGSGITSYTYRPTDDDGCPTCNSLGYCMEPASAEDCDCELCETGYWFYPSPVGDVDALHYENLEDAIDDALKVSGEITKRKWITKLIGNRNPIRYLDHVTVLVVP